MTLLGERLGVASHRRRPTTCCMFFGLAEAKTSAGAPWLICCGQRGAGAEVELHRGAGMRGLELLGDRGERLGQRRGGEDRDGAGRRRTRPRRSNPSAEPDPLSSPNCRSGGEGEGRDGRGRREQTLHRCGTSTTTLVDFTDAMATTRARDQARRRLRGSSGTPPGRRRPAVSTCAITLSRVTRVTMPRNRLRADSATTGTSATAADPSAAVRRGSRPAPRRRPPSECRGSRTVGNRPESAQRRTVSSLTPSSEATSLIR